MPPRSTSEHTLTQTLSTLWASGDAGLDSDEEDMEPEITTTADDLNEGYHLGGLSHWLHGTSSTR